MRVYGGCIEPGGMELDDDTYEAKCPECGSEHARKRSWQGCEGGSINNYWSLNCEDCGYSDGVYADYWDD